MVTAAREARIWRENVRVGMRDRFRGLEEVKCQIGIQIHGENGYDRLTFITSSRSTRGIPPKVSPKFLRQ